MIPLHLVKDCPKCGAQLPPPLTETVMLRVCYSCGEILKAKDGEVTSVSLPENKHKYKLPPLEIGRKITLRGIECKVGGYSVNKEKGKPYFWSEFYLYGPEGVVTLAEFKGGFNLIWPASHAVSGLAESKGGHSLTWEGEEYLIYNRYTIEVVEVKGDIPFDHTEPTAAIEYICPPRLLLVQSDSKKKREFFTGEYISVKELSAALGVKLPSPEVQPATRVWLKNLKSSSVWLTFFAFFTLMTATYFVAWYAGTERHHLTEEFTLDSTFGLLAPKEFKTSSFKVEGPGSMLAVHTHVAVNNHWLSYEYILVNEQSNEETYFSGGVEYYYGYEDGTHWIEGSQVNTDYLSSLPAGTYHLILKAEPDPKLSALFSIATTVVEDPVTSSNFWWLSFFGVLFPIGFSWINGIYEKKRWENSDFSPYD